MIKKFCIGMFCFMVAFSLAACGNNKEGDENKETVLENPPYPQTQGDEVIVSDNPTYDDMPCEIDIEQLRYELRWNRQLLSETNDRYSRLALPGEPSYDGMVHDEQFAGIWYDEDGNLNVGVINDDRSESRNPAVIYHIRRFSYNFLWEIHRAITSGFMHIVGDFTVSDIKVVSVGMTPQYNQVSVGVLDEKYISEVIEYLSGLSLYEEGAIKFRVTEMARTLCLCCNGVYPQ